MKKILLLLVLLPILTFSQSWRTQTVAVDSGSYSSDAFAIPENYGLKSIIFPAMTSGTTSFKLLVGTTSTSLDTLYYDDAEYNPTIDVDGCPYSISANVSYGWQWFKVLFATQQTADVNLTIISIKQQ